MNSEITLTLIILIAAVILFISERLRSDIVALLTLLALVLTGLITPEEGFSGFASPAVITVWSVFIISGGLTTSGVADRIANQLIRLSGDSETRLIIVMMVITSVMSAFMNDIGAVAIMMPAVISVSRRKGIPPSYLLMPLAWSALLGGCMTLIGTPPNILATNIMASYGVTPFEFFDFTPMGVIYLVFGILYVIIFGKYVLPRREEGKKLTDEYTIKPFLCEVRIKDNSPVDGKTLKELELDNLFFINVLQIVKEDGSAVPASAESRLESGQILFLQAPADHLLQAVESLRFERLSGHQVEDDQLARARKLRMVEVVLSPKSSLDGMNLREINFRAIFGLSVVAIRKEGITYQSRLAEVPILIGDSFLVEGPRDRIDRLRENPEFLILDKPVPKPKKTNKMYLSLLIMAAVIVSVLFSGFDVPVVMLAGAVLMVLTGVLNMEEAYQSINWKSIFLIAGMLPLGIAMENTGTAAFLAEKVVSYVGGLGAFGVLIGVYLLTILLTEVMSNAATAVLITPIAIDVAYSMGANPQTYVMAIVLAASSSFMLPVAHQANIIIFGPGRYKFSDYPRAAFGLTVLLLVVVSVFLPIIWPL